MGGVDTEKVRCALKEMRFERWRGGWLEWRYRKLQSSPVICTVRVCVRACVRACVIPIKSDALEAERMERRERMEKMEKMEKMKKMRKCLGRGAWFRF